jgi:hypothetical protein
MFVKGVRTVNAFKTDTFVLNESIEPVSKTVATVCELTEAETSQVIGGTIGGHNPYDIIGHGPY